MIYEIKSKYILKHILNYIKIKKFQLLLFFYSKDFQNKLEINLSTLYKKYLSELDFDFNRYLHKDEKKYKKDILKKEFNDFILKNKLNKEKIEKILYEVINNQNIKDEENNEKYINLDSPLFEIISKTKDFSKLYTIYISQKNIDEYKLKDDYIMIFKKLNESNIKYSSIFYIYNNKTKLGYLNTLNINYDNINNLIFIIKDYQINNNEDKSNIINILNLFKKLEKVKLRLNQELDINIKKS